MRSLAFVVLCFLGLSVFFASFARAEGAHVQRRVAVVVGANAPPPGRAALRFAYDDARAIGDALTRVGHFAPDDVHQLLDPTPAALLQTIDDVAKSAGEDALVLFYYSGHSDGQSLYPHGEALSVADVRDRLARMGARVRVGILDTCRGGNWTQAKGITVGPPLDPIDLLNVTTEGTALVSSSSGLESAHEAESAHGSFFTHYFTAGLLGAADANGDGEVTLEEAYDYARERTVRDSARLAPTPQHPSFDLQLRGRQDIVLASLQGNTSAIEIEQPDGPIEVIHLATGTTLAEVPPSSRAVKIAVPPARYLIRRVVQGQVFSKEVVVGARETVTLAPGQLEATGTDALAMKGGEEKILAPLDLWTPNGKHWLVSTRFGIGTHYFAVASPGANTAAGTYQQSLEIDLDIWWRITDRLAITIPYPVLSYRFGDAGGVEVMTSGGFRADSYDTYGGLSAAFVAEAATRLWTAHNQFVYLDATGYMPVYKQGDNGPLGVGSALHWQTTGGYTLTLGRVSMSARAGYDQDFWQGTLVDDWVIGTAAVDVRVSERLSLSAGFSYDGEIYDHHGYSQENAWVGLTGAF